MGRAGFPNPCALVHCYSKCLLLGVVGITGWGWKGPLQVTCCNPLVRQDHLEPVAQDHVQGVFQYLKGGDSTTSLFPCLVTLMVMCFLRCRGFHGVAKDFTLRMEQSYLDSVLFSYHLFSLKRYNLCGHRSGEMICICLPTVQNA